MMTLVKQIYFKPSHKYFKEFDKLCFLSKNLYNATLYVVRKYFFETGSYLNYNSVNKMFTVANNVDYRALPTKVSKHTQMLVDKSFKSFFTLLEKKKNNQYNSPVKIPKYLKKNTGRQVVHYEKGALSFKRNGFIKLSRTDIYIKNDNISKESIQFIRVVPKGQLFVVEIGYKVQNKDSIANQNIASIDLGINNLISMVDNVTKKGIIINGKPLKSINQYFNKQKSEIQSILVRSNKKYSSKKIQKLYIKRNNKIKDYIHKTTRYIVNHLVSNNISTLVVGYNKNWKQDISIGRVNNQNFVQIPFLMILNQLEYKCKLEGIILEIQEESYTSKCSFLDNEEICRHSKYKGLRIKRGLFKTSFDKFINADINASCNILRKYLKKESNKFDVKKTLNDLVEVFSTPLYKVKCFN